MCLLGGMCLIKSAILARKYTSDLSTSAVKLTNVKLVIMNNSTVKV